MNKHSAIIVILAASAALLTACYGSGTLIDPGSPDADTDAGEDVVSCKRTCSLSDPCCPAEMCGQFVDEDSGVCVKRSGEEARTRDNPDTTENDSYVDLSCLATEDNPNPYPEKWQGAATSRLEGCVDAFGLGFDTRYLHVAVYEMKKDGEIGRKLDETLADDEGYYRFTAQLPTNRFLVTKVWGQGVRDTYKYNIQIPAGLVQDGVFYDNAFVISDSTWLMIPRIAIQQSLTPGKGVMAGSIRDCTELTEYVHERPSCERAAEGEGGSETKILKLEDWAEIKGARVSFLEDAEGLVYFNGNEDDLAPIPVRVGSRDELGTNDDATWATINQDPGLNLVGAAAVIDGQLTGLGAIPVKVFGDSVTIANLVVWGHPTAAD